MTPTNTPFDPLTLIPDPRREEQWPDPFTPTTGTPPHTRHMLQEMIFQPSQAVPPGLAARGTFAAAILLLEDHAMVGELLSARLVFAFGPAYPVMSVRGFLKWVARTREPFPGSWIVDAQEVLLEQLSGWWHQGRRSVHYSAGPGDVSPFSSLLFGRHAAYAALPGLAELAVFLQHMTKTVPWLSTLRFCEGEDLIKQARLVLEEAERFKAAALDLPWASPAWPGHLPVNFCVRDVLARLGGL